jgi:flagellar biosynthesis protein FliP
MRGCDMENKSVLSKIFFFFPKSEACQRGERMGLSLRFFIVVVVVILTPFFALFVCLFVSFIIVLLDYILSEWDGT